MRTWGERARRVQPFYPFVFPSVFTSGINKRALTSYLLRADTLYLRKCARLRTLSFAIPNSCERFLFLTSSVIFPYKWISPRKRAQSLNNAIKLFSPSLYSSTITRLLLLIGGDRFEETRCRSAELSPFTIYLVVSHVVLLCASRWSYFTSNVVAIQIFAISEITDIGVPLKGLKWVNMRQTGYLRGMWKI